VLQVPKIQFRRDTAAQWTTHNPTLLNGEIGIESDTHRFKLGDGTTAWSSLLYSSRSLADDPLAYVEGLNVTSISYNSDGTISAVNYNGGNVANYNYTTGNLTSVVYTDTDGTTTVVTLTYGYDGNGRLNTITKTVA
jgi:hypothetical protein